MNEESQRRTPGKFTVRIASKEADPSFKEYVEGEFDTLDMDTQSRIAHRMSDIQTKLTPKVTVKQEETGLDGVKRTLWSEKQA